jgi:branched-chain amino acid transport system permease protein
VTRTAAVPPSVERPPPAHPPGGRASGRAGIAAGLAVLGALGGAPFVLGSYEIGLLSRVLAFALLAQSVHLLTNITGLPTLGQAAYFGVGAYAAVLVGLHVTRSGPVQLVIAAGAGLLAAAATGWVAVRTRGTVFLMLTLAIGELLHQLADSWAVVGASNGLPGRRVSVLPGGEPLQLAGLVYWYVLAVSVLGYLAMALVVRSPFGRTLRGIADNEARMRSLGYSTSGAKYLAYCLAGAVAGAAGALFVAQTRFVSPGDLGFEVAVLALLAVVIGGTSRLWGPVLGAAIVVYVREDPTGLATGHGPLLLGVAFILIVYLLPQGIGGVIRRRGRPRSDP